jgi:multidrug efflux system membrane fusion protein
MKKPLWTGVAVVVLAVAAAGAYLYVRHERKPAAQAAGAVAKAPSRRGIDPNRAMPVVTAVARKDDVSLYLTGLGTITPLKSVTVRSRVDGELLRVAFTEGQLVKEGDLLAEIDPRPFRVQLMQAEGQMTRDQALLANARIDLERYSTHFEQDSIAKQQVDTQAALVRQYEGTVRTDQSAIDSARLQLGYARITAPISGRLGLRQVDPGNIVRAGDANGLVVITQLEPIGVIFSIPQDSLQAVLKKLRSGEKPPVEAWDRDNRVKLATGELITVDNQIDPATGTVKLKGQFANSDRGLFPNQFVNVRMRVDTLRGVTTVPSAALQRGARGPFVYVVKPDSTVTMRPVKLGAAEGGRTTIDSGIAPGERVVTDGLDRLREGAKIEVAESPSFGTGAVKGAGKKGAK